MENRRLKITGLESVVVSVPIKKVYPTSVGAFRGHVTAVLVKLRTDDGLIGIGESPVLSRAEFTKQMVDSCKPLLVGQDPFDVDVIRRRLYANFNLIHFHLHAANWAISGIEMAMLDLIGKSCKKPLYKLWGGALRKKIAFWGWVAGGRPGAMARESKAFVKQGFTTLYTKVGIDEDWDFHAVKAMREAVGYNGKIKIRVDANQAWSVSTAIRMIKRLEKFELEFVEQPVLMYNLDALKRIRQAVDTPILSHESSWTFYDALNVIKHDAADAIQLDPRFDAGFTGARIAAGMADAAGMSAVIHSFSDLGITTSSYLHLIASSPAFLHANQTNYYALEDDVIAEKLVFKDGSINLPERPGIGIDIDEEKVRKYSRIYEKEVKGKEFIGRAGQNWASLGIRSRGEEWVPRSPRC